MYHLVQRGRDQAAETDDVGVLLARRLQDLLCRHHDAEVDDVVVVALEHDADDVLADVVDVALDRRQHDLALGLRGVRSFLLRLDIGHEIGDRLFHDPRALDHLGQEHLSLAEQVADDVHAVHQRPLDHVERPRGRLPRFLGVLDDVFVDAVDQRVRQPRVDGALAPGQVLGLLLCLALYAVRDLEQPLGRVGPPVQDHVLHPLAQVAGDILVDRELPGVDDAHGHALADRVVEEHGVHGLAHRGCCRGTENDTLLTPPLTIACGSSSLIRPVASMKSRP